MAKVELAERTSFFREVEAAATRAVYCPIATNVKDGPRVRIDPIRVELSKMFGSQDQRVWRRW